MKKASKLHFANGNDENRQSNIREGNQASALSSDKSKVLRSAERRPSFRYLEQAQQSGENR